MAAEQRKLLEQLMGDTLNAPGVSRAPQISITDSKVCRPYLVGTCPHDLFTNTKNDLGVCPRIHSESLKAEYDAASQAEKMRWGFEFDYLREMSRYMDECNRKIDIAQRRLEKTPDEIRQTNQLLKQISELSKTSNAGLLELSILGDIGAINQAIGDHFKLRQTQEAKQERERELKALAETSGPSGHQKLQVCDVCGAYLSRLDNDRRLADHFYGKMHLGYAQMRKSHAALQQELKGRAIPLRDDAGSDTWNSRGGSGHGRTRGAFRGGSRGARW